MNVTEMTRKDFERLPWRDGSFSGTGVCDSIVILPAQVPRWRFWYHGLRMRIIRVWNSISPFQTLKMRELEEWESIPGFHDSNFRCMDFVAVVDGEAVCRLAGGSDVLHIEGIGGYGYKWSRLGGVPKLIHVAGWQFDCLPKSGLLRLWPNDKIIYTEALSSFEIYSMPPTMNASQVGREQPLWQEHLDQAKMLLGGE
jgi:hypothetical protein